MTTRYTPIKPALDIAYDEADDWRDQAACTGYDPELWYSRRMPHRRPGIRARQDPPRRLGRDGAPREGSARQEAQEAGQMTCQICGQEAMPDDPLCESCGEGVSAGQENHKPEISDAEGCML